MNSSISQPPFPPGFPLTAAMISRYFENYGSASATGWQTARWTRDFFFHPMAIP
jgi:hypothetical protein